MGIVKVSPPIHSPFSVHIHLPRSKSIANRYLLLEALWPSSLHMEEEVQAKDSIELKEALQYVNSSHYINAGEGGTSFRFLLAYLAAISYKGELHASGSMQYRPIDILVDALRQLGSEIDYLDKEGYPPVKLYGSPIRSHTVHIDATQSSQYISALLLIGAYLPKGLHLMLHGSPTSQSYIQLSIRILRDLGCQVEAGNDYIRIPPAEKLAEHTQVITIETDWSGASYFWAAICLLPLSELFLYGLSSKQLQGDAIIADWARQQGFTLHYEAEGVRFVKGGRMTYAWTDELDLTHQPDLAQTVICLYAALGKPIVIHGLHTLFIKETNRLAALQEALASAGHLFTYTTDGSCKLTPNCTASAEQPIFDSYLDHRMAMSLCLLACSQPISIKDPQCVRKSFPGFWQEWEKLGFSLVFTPPWKEI